jgi:hypothetical protein
MAECVTICPDQPFSKRLVIRYGLYTSQKVRLILQQQCLSQTVLQRHRSRQFSAVLLEKEKLDGGGRGTVILAGQPSTRVSASDRA